MAFWWVNHNQTYRQEIEGGYIWSPKANKNGARNETYLNLTRTSLGDRVFSYANAAIRTVGVIEGPFQPARRPDSFGELGGQWGADGWLVPVAWTLLTVPFSPKAEIARIAPLLPEKHAPIRPNGNGLQGCYLAGIGDQLGELLLEIAARENPEIVDRMNDDLAYVEEDDRLRSVEQGDLPPTEKEQVSKARLGQGLFRQRVEALEKRCRVTGITDVRFLVASHIKPWSVSTNAERLDGHNGLLLAPHIDRLFDRGWISFSDAGELLVSQLLPNEVRTCWGIDKAMSAKALSSKQREYMRFHRDELFRRR